MTTHSRTFLAMIGIATLLLGLVGTPAASTPESATPGEVTTYRAELSPLNSDVNGGDAHGTATFTISGDELTIKIEVEGVAPNIQHLQHFHGFADSDDAATCPTMDTADTNHDGVVDLIETEPMAGTTMVPFTTDPVSMEIVEATYPTANADGSYTYEQTVSLSALDTAFTKQFPEQTGLNLDKRVVFIHTVAEDAELPETAQSLPGIPAQVTLPVACGQIHLVENGTPAATPVK